MSNLCDKDSRNAAMRQYRKTAKNIAYDKKFRKAYLQTTNGITTALLIATRKRAKLKNLELDLDRAWIAKKVAPKICEVTALPLSFKKDDRYHHSPFKPSIDRIDSSKGYTKDNCQIVAGIYNKAKSDSTMNDVLLMANALMEKLNG